jgi:hypothetical protein
MVDNTKKYISKFLDNINENTFSSENFIDEDKGIFRVNCSGLAKYIFKKLGTSIESHKAFEIFDELKERSFVDINELEAGDLIIWRKNNVPKTGSTGHMAIFLEEVSRDENSMTVKVLDASKKMHDNDSRSEPGIGIGEFKIIRDGLKPKGFIWSKIDKKTKITEIIFVKP